MGLHLGPCTAANGSNLAQDGVSRWHPIPPPSLMLFPLLMALLPLHPSRRCRRHGLHRPTPIVYRRAKTSKSAVPQVAQIWTSQLCAHASTAVGRMHNFESPGGVIA